MPVTVVIARTDFTIVLTIMSIIHCLIITVPSGRLKYIILPLFQTLMSHLWFGKSLKEAIAAPVVFVDSKNALRFEANFDKVLYYIQCIYLTE